MGKLDGKIAVITGGNSGIGLASAHVFAQEGAEVVIFGRDESTLRAASAAIGAAASAVRGDASRLEDIDRLMAAVQARHGRIDVLFANAGGSRVRTTAQISEADFDTTVAQNLKSAFFTVQKGVALMGKGGAVILTTSIGGAMPSRSDAVYGACKAGVRALARSFSAEYLPRGVRVNALAPGPVATPGLMRMGMSEREVAAFKESYAKGAPMRRWGEAEELARCALFLACEDSSYVAGIELYADGGVYEVR